MGGRKAGGRRVSFKLDGDRLLVSVSKHGRAVSEGSAMAEARKLFPSIQWERVACANHRALVISAKLTDAEIAEIMGKE